MPKSKAYFLPFLMKSVKALETRRLYTFEDGDERTVWLDAELPISVLRRLGHKIWEKYGFTNNPPVIKAIRGSFYNGILLSYSSGATFVGLSRHQRTRRILIHEMTHILGPINHGKNFVELNIKLLVEFGKYKKHILIERLKAAKILSEK